ncbi:hypothetical protein PM082_021730 [Marasmius tenuissimus]|nr:hypothetical protein PM082_021730 [Marasmius tenuissimus]
MSQFFRNSRSLTVSDSSFSHVEGSQYIYTGPAYVIQRRSKKYSKHGEVRMLKRGDICKLRDIHIDKYQNRYWWRKGRNVDKTFCVAELDGRGGRLFTVVSYTGAEARKEFEEDLRKYLASVTSNALQVFAIDAGRIPSLIFWNELVPVAHFEKAVGILAQMYLLNVCRQLNCDGSELWLDTARGVLCCGPAGPDPDLPWRGLGIKNLPLTFDLLEEDNLLRLLSNYNSKQVDLAFMKAVYSMRQLGVIEGAASQPPNVVHALTDAPIAVASHCWKHPSDFFSNRRFLENGLTRFTIVDNGYPLCLDLNWDAGEAWLSQASNIFHSRQISFEDDLSCYQLFRMPAWLRSETDQPRVACKHPIYLFVRHPPDLLNCDASSLCFWSSREDGLSPLPTSTCLDLGLPVAFVLKADAGFSHSWPSEAYKLIDRYQLARGFDPTTSDFARHLGYHNIFQPIDDSIRFQEVEQESDPGRRSQGCKTYTSFWSSITAPFSSTVADNSDILTVGF